jgi:hypothetical protein
MIEELTRKSTVTEIHGFGLEMLKKITAGCSSALEMLKKKRL